MRRAVVAVLLLAAGGVIAACARSGGSASVARVVVALDFSANPAHAPIFLASRERFDRRYGVGISIRAPGSAPDTLKLLASARADIGVLDISDLALARERGEDLVGIATLVRRPLAAIIAQPYIRTPRQLNGKRVGVSGLASDPAFLRAVLSQAGASYASVHLVTIGFGAVSQMIAGNVAAVPAFWSDEGVALRLRGLAVREFRVEDYGAPRYPEVVLVATRRTLAGRRASIARALATKVIADAAQAGDRRLIRARLDALAPALLPPLRLEPRVLRQWSAFATRTGLLARPLDVDRAFDFTLAPTAAAIEKPPGERSRAPSPTRR